MNKQMLIIGTVVLLLIVGLSGCTNEIGDEGDNEFDNNGDGTDYSQDFEVSDLLVSSSEVEAGNSVVIWADVENSNDEQGTYEIELLIDDIVEDSETLILDPNESEIISFTIVKNQIKMYTVSVGDLSTTFEVIEATEEDIPQLEGAPESYRLSVPVVCTTVVMPKYCEDEDEWEDSFGGGLCYLASFAMLALYDDSSLDFSDVIAYSGIGTTINVGPDGLGVGYGLNSINTAADNLGYELALGILDDGVVGSNFESEEITVTTFNNQSEAFNYLANTIALDIAVMVHLNTYYIRDDLAKVTFKWAMNDKAHSSHFMVVTGYEINSDCIYLNDMSGHTIGEGVDMPVSTESFLQAWENAAYTTWGANNGPYWMIYIKGSGSRKSIVEIKSWNKEVSENTSSQIISYASGSPSLGNPTYLAELTKARMEFAAFLEKNQDTEAASVYEEISEFYRTLPSASDLVTSLNEIADLEEDAQGLY
jgi:hypothetical protein